MSHRGPRPSLLPEVPAPAGFGIDRDGVAILLASMCWDRASYSNRAEAGARATWSNRQEGTTLQVAPYRCPFHDKYRGHHWHVGELLTVQQLELVAAAIRWCAAYPDERPTPPRTA